MIYKDRHQAGKLLAKKLSQLSIKNPVVYALPRGGVPVAKPIAEALFTKLNLILVRKLGFPSNPEVAMGALALDETMVVDFDLINRADIATKEFSQILNKEKAELNRRVDKYSLGITHESLVNKTAIIVDDGLTPGGTIKAAVKYIKNKDPRAIIVAVPVCPTGSINEFKHDVDLFVCLDVISDFNSVSSWYERFPQISDQEVISTLEEINT